MIGLAQILRHRTLLSTISFLLLGLSAVSATQVLAAEPTPSDAVAAEFPNQFFPENLPGADVVDFYPHDWTTYAANAGRNPVYGLLLSGKTRPR
jgi:hypothetical protein